MVVNLQVRGSSLSGCRCPLQESIVGLHNLPANTECGSMRTCPIMLKVVLKPQIESFYLSKKMPTGDSSRNSDSYIPSLSRLASMFRVRLSDCRRREMEKRALEKVREAKVRRRRGMK